MKPGTNGEQHTRKPDSITRSAGGNYEAFLKANLPSSSKRDDFSEMFFTCVRTAKPDIAGLLKRGVGVKLAKKYTAKKKRLSLKQTTLSALDESRIKAWLPIVSAQYVKESVKIARLAAKDPIEMRKLLQSTGFEGFQLRVVDAVNKTFVGIKGIVVHETKNTFILSSDRARSKIIPKQSCNFEIEFPGDSTRSVRMLLAGSGLIGLPTRRIKQKCQFQNKTND